MKGINRRLTGFRFGLHRLRVRREFEVVPHAGRTYKVLLVRTENNLDFISVRLYNADGHFIKQLLMEPAIAAVIGRALQNAGQALVLPTVSKSYLARVSKTARRGRPKTQFNQTALTTLRDAGLGFRAMAAELSRQLGEPVSPMTVRRRLLELEAGGK